MNQYIKENEMKPENNIDDELPMTEFRFESELPIMMTVQELAQFLRISKNTAYIFVKSGVIPSVKVGRQTRIYREDVMRFVNRAED